MEHPAATRSLEYKSSQTRRKRIRTALYHLSVGVLGLIMIYPILWLFASSLKGADEIWTHAASLIPKTLTFKNYVNGWQGFGGITFATFFKNSFIYAGVTTIASVVSSAFVALCLCQNRFSGTKILVYGHAADNHAAAPGLADSPVYHV